MSWSVNLANRRNLASRSRAKWLEPRPKPLLALARCAVLIALASCAQTDEASQLNAVVDGYLKPHMVGNQIRASNMGKDEAPFRTGKLLLIEPVQLNPSRTAVGLHPDQPSIPSEIRATGVDEAETYGFCQPSFEAKTGVGYRVTTAVYLFDRDSRKFLGELTVVGADPPAQHQTDQSKVYGPTGLAEAMAKLPLRPLQDVNI